MRRFLDSIKGRVGIAFVIFVGLANMAGLWLYSVRSEVAINLLHDALVAERIATMVRIADVQSKKPDAIAALVHGNDPRDVANGSQTKAILDGDRSDLLRHLVGTFLNRRTDSGITVEYLEHEFTAGSDKAVNFINAASHLDRHHQLYTPISEISRSGTIIADIALSDGSKLKLAIPAMRATSFSPSNLGGAIVAVVIVAMLAAIWMLNRWTQPLVHFAAAADRLGADIKAPPLPVEGLYEVRTAAKAFNRMQERIQRLVEDTNAMAAAIAHDLGTPVTRLRLRAEEIDDVDIKAQVLSDIEQMRRMMSSTLEFARLNSDQINSETFDLASLTEAVCSDYIDLGEDVTISGPSRLSIVSDPTSMRRILANIIDNAVKYGGSARVALAREENAVRILVDDDGPGIPAELRAAALAPFRRLPSLRNQDARGTGLGLAVAQHLVARLGGQIELCCSSSGGLRVMLVFARRGQQL